MTFKNRILKTAFALCASATMLSVAVAQDAKSMAKQLGTTQLKDQTLSLVNSQKYLEARPYMTELITRINDSDDVKMKKQLEDLYFFMAYSYVQEYDATKNPVLLKNAISYFDKVIDQFPGGDMAKDALSVKASCYEIQGKHVEAAEVREKLLQAPYSNGMSYAKKYEIVKKIADSLFIAEKHQAAEKWMKLKLESSKEPEDKVSSASALIQIAVKLKKLDEVKQYLSYMSINTISRSDISLNMALLNAGDELAGKKRFSEASVLYSMVFDRATILKNLTTYADSSKKRIATLERINPTNPYIAPLKTKVQQIEAQIAAINERIPDYTADLMIRESRNYMQTNRDYESFWSYMQLIETAPDHSSVEDFYISAIMGAYKVGKMDTMFELCETYLKKFESGQYYNDVIIRKAQYWIDKENYAEFFKIAKAFIDEFPDETPYSSDIIFMMGSTWLKTSNYEELVKTFKKYNEDYEDSAISEGVLYWLGMGYLAQADFKNSAKTFGTLTENYPVGPYSEDAMYRHGVSAFGMGDFPQARDVLENFISNYPKSSLRGEVEFFLGDIYANNAAVEQAMEHYNNVEKYTDNQAIIDSAYTQSAKLLSTTEKYEEIVKMMSRYLANETFVKNGIPSRINYEKALAEEKLGMPADSLAVYADAIEKYGDNPLDDGVDKMILDYDRLFKENIEKLTATIAFIENLMKDRELLYNMVEVPAKRYRYFQANPKIDKVLYEKFKRDTNFGPNLYNNKSNLEKLLAKYKDQIARYPKLDAENFFKQSVEKAREAKRITLEYRLLMGLDAIGKPVSVNKMFDAQDIKNSSVRTLAWVGKINEKFGPDEARKAFNEASARDEYEYLIDVLFASAELETRQKNWSKVLAIYDQIERDFPSDPRAARAALDKAAALMGLGKNKEAVEKYEEVLKSNSWRGEAYAEALFQLGNIAEKKNDVNAALMYYDRCYLGYANCFNWTGKAVVKAAKLLSAQGKGSEAKQLCQEFTTNEGNKQSPEYDEIKQLILTL